MSTSMVFIPHEEYVWVSGQILVDADAKGIVEVKILDELLPNENKARQINLAKFRLPSLPQQNIDIPVHGVEDMTKLNYLHEPSILDNLKRRFKNSMPYTYTGEVCVAVNPYKWLPLYTDELRAKYSKSTRHELAPHVYATSTDAYRGLTTRGKNQSVLVTGESGAGKTETVKILMGHLAYIAGKSGDKTVDKLLKANPLLETFGNAKTARNDNSSRFGKFSQLEFDDLYVLVGSKCVTYLLEKSRVITQTKLERNYHIMYQLLAAPDNVKEKLMLNGKTSASFKFTNGGDIKTNIIEGMTDADRYNQTSEGLNLLGIGINMRQYLEKTIAGILHMGQINFHNVRGSADASTILTGPGKFDESTLACCRMLGVDPEQFASSIVSRVIDVEGKKLSVPLSVEQAASGRDALAKEIYSRIFNWLILVINFNTSYVCNTTEEERFKMTYKHGGCSSISLLDIFGFECFTHNGFEQFCINFANEKLQQRFTQDVFKTVQREYQEEGLPWDIIHYKDNQETLDMIEGRLGIIDLLNEECQIPKGTDANFLTKLKANFGQHYAFSFDQRSRESFTIRHYAGQVTYNVLGFMDANKDAVPNNLTSLMGTSDSVLVRRLFADTPYFGGQGSADSEALLLEDRNFIINLLMLNQDEGEYASIPKSDNVVSDRTPNADRDESPMRGVRSASSEDLAGGGRGRAMTIKRAGGGFVVSEKILTKFKNQLGSLMDVVNSTDVQYVRCIKPNPNKSSTEYDRRMVVEQLRSAGMIEAVRISRAAYPNRLGYKEFMGRFHLLRPKRWHDSVLKNLAGQSPDDQLKGTTKAFLAWILPDNRKSLNDGTGTTTHYAFGYTKVYFTSFVLETLEAARNKAVYNHVCAIQKIGRGYVERKRYSRMIKAAVLIRKTIRIFAAKWQLRKIRNALILIQSLAAMRYVRKRYVVQRDEYRQDMDIKRAQKALEERMNLEAMRQKAEEERQRKIAEAEAARQRAIEAKLREEEEARRAEEDRIRLIEEAKRAEEAKLRHYESLDRKVKEDAELIDELRRKEDATRREAEEEKARLRRLEARLNEALDKIEGLESREAAQKAEAWNQEKKLKDLETKYTESQQTIEALKSKEVVNQQAHDEEIARMKANETKLKASAAAEKQKLLDAQDELLALERMKKPPVVEAPPPGDVDVVVEEEKGRLRVVIVRKKPVIE